ncbi:MAG: restriction endonuclease subunit S [Candidatus Sericytochromatia bacterium]
MNPELLLTHFETLIDRPEKVTELRKLILQLAVMGKLVPQDANDEPASELLKRIAAEKAALVKEGKLKREKPLPPIDPAEQPFELPQGWVWVRLNNLLSKIGAGSTPLGGKQVYVTSGVKFLRSQNVWDDGLRIDDVALIPDSIHQKMSGTQVQPKDLLFNITGASIGRCALVPDDFDTANVSQHVTIIRLLNPCFRFFLHTVLVSELVQKMVMDVQVGVSREGLSIGKLSQFVVPLPPLAEQERIVAKVDQLLAHCDALEDRLRRAAEARLQLSQASLRSLEAAPDSQAFGQSVHFLLSHWEPLTLNLDQIARLKQTLLQLAVMGKLVPQDPNDEPASELLKRIAAEKAALVNAGKLKREKPLPPIDPAEQPFALPQGWVWVRTDSISLVIVDCPHSTPKFIMKGIFCIDTNTFKSGKLIPHKFRYVDESTYLDRIARLEPLPGDIVFAREGSVGESVVIPEGVKCCLGQRVMLFRPFHEIKSDYFRLMLSEPGSLSRLLNLHKGIGAKHVNVGDMKMALVPLPPLAEQERIVAKVDQLLALCDQLAERTVLGEAENTQLLRALIHT